VYDRPGDVRSVPRIGKPTSEDSPEYEWQRAPGGKVGSLPDEEDVYDRPGDVRSIPRDGRPKEDESPEYQWQRTPGPKAPGVPDEEDVYDRPGDVRSIPRDGRPKTEDVPEYGWQRYPTVANDFKDEDEPFERPGQISSIPRSNGPDEQEEGDQPYDWDRHPRNAPDMDWSTDKPDNVQFKKDEPLYDWSGGRPDKLAAVPRPGEGEEPDYDWSSDKPDDALYKVASPDADWSADKPDDALWKKDEPLYDWAGARPEQLAAVPRPAEGEEPEPDYDWSSDKPDDALWKKNEPNYDWSGARPDEPFERPRDMVATEPTTGLDGEEGLPSTVPDDLSEYTQEDDDEPKPVTGVPCAAWTFLAAGVVAGGMASTLGPAVVPQGVPPQPQLFTGQDTEPSATDLLFPDPNSLGACANDPACGVIMDGLGPNIPPGTRAAINIPGTCQSKARDWLRTGKDVLEFNAERIRQRYAITVFFCETDGGDWLENDMWLSDLHECDWYNRLGLDACNRVEQLEIIRIQDNGLQGTLTPELSIVSSLFELTLTDNMVTGTFPSDYASLSELDTFSIAFNQFEGTVPGFVWRFPDMVYLDIGYNRFTGPLPADIPERMPFLETLLMENNNISGTIPTNLGSLNLRRLHMDDNKLTGTIPTELGQPPRLQQLYLHGNQLTGPIPTELAELGVLNILTLHYNSLGGSGNNGLGDEITDAANSGSDNTVDSTICRNNYEGQLRTISVDCATISCECCVCGEPDIV
jgi:Leucine-rich repeat (LRR) protein